MLSVRRCRAIAVLVGLLIRPFSSVTERARADPTFKTNTTLDFNRQILPILSENCFACHGPDAKSRKAKLRLDTKDGMFAELRSGGHAVVPGKPDLSALVERTAAEDPSQIMPPPKTGKKLKPEQVELLRRWVEQGARWSVHWAFVVPNRTAVPEVRNRSWPRNQIDFFILSRLESVGLQPQTQADRAKLLRRVTLDLTGLPPTPAECDDFCADKSPDAYERVVNRLLASARYGEHMARFWLDAARYGDTHGLHLDNYREMWPFRTWVIKALNSNMPYDQFLIKQLAGDLLPDAKPDDIVASGFNRCHVTTSEGGSIDEEVYVRNVDDRIDTVGTVFMGLTVGCARCHDHKYDPLKTKEYYQLFAFFNSLDEKPLDGNQSLPPPIVRLPNGKQEAALSCLRKESSAIAKQVSRQLTACMWGLIFRRAGNETRELLSSWRQFAALEQKRVQLERQVPASLVSRELCDPRPAYVLRRGEYDQRGERVGRETPRFLPTLDEDAPRNRLGFARWLIGSEHPLTARVAVNRLWQQCFGTGLVKTAEDFGTQGEPPSHPELLDWLAIQFRADGWDMKKMMKRIVMSATYRQSGHLTLDRLAKDPGNRLLSRGPRYRLDAETLRDQALAVSGLLVERLGGPSVKPPQPAGLWEAVGYTASNTARFVRDRGCEKVHRRSLYTFWKRTSPPPQMTAFDAPSRESCTVRRERTDTPLQALLIMNETQFVEAARELASRALREGGTRSEARLGYLFKLATARPPNANELSELQKILRDLLAHYRGDPRAAQQFIAVGESTPDSALDPSELAAWSMVANLVLNLDETLCKG
jgi:hypothetical protein